MHFKWYQFSELTLHQLYTILALRSEVFVVEQNCAYLDPDGKDQDALHLLGVENNCLSAYLRLFPPAKNNVVKFGRVLTVKTGRTQGFGKKLMHELLQYCEKNFPGIPIECAAQLYLKKFYESFGFKIIGEPFDDVGIPHILMIKNQ